MEVTCVAADDDNYFFVGTVKTNYNSEVFAEDTIGTNAGEVLKPNCTNIVW